MKKTKNPMMRRATAAVGAGALLLAAGGVQAALQDRDLDGTGRSMRSTTRT